jgi:hypothetical protein
LGALVLCLPHLPPPLLTPHLPALLPLLNRALLLQVNRYFRPVSVSWNRNQNLRNLNLAEPECITVREPDLDLDLTLNGIINQESNERPTFWEIMLLLVLRGKILCKFFVVKNCAKYCLDPEPEPKLF